MLDALTSLVSNFWGLYTALAYVLGIYGVAAFFLSFREFVESYKENEFPIGALKYLLLAIPLPLYLLLAYHDQWVTCDRDLDRDPFELTGYDRVQGQLNSHNCWKYRRGHGLTYNSENW